MKPLYNFCHRPNIGDIIYALPVIRRMGRGNLYLETKYLRRKVPNWRLKQLSYLPSFLLEQEYIEECQIGWPEDEKPSDVYNLGNYVSASCMKRRLSRKTIVYAHYEGMGMLPMTEDDKKPWLTCSIKDQYPIALNLTRRYRDYRIDYSFLEGHDVIALGGRADQKYMKAKVPHCNWVKTGGSFSDFAAMVNSCKVYIGCQSAGYAIAAGLGKNRMLEEYPKWPNCTFGDSNEFILTRDAKKNSAMLEKALAD